VITVVIHWRLWRWTWWWYTKGSDDDHNGLH